MPRKLVVSSAFYSSAAPTECLDEMIWTSSFSATRSLHLLFAPKTRKLRGATKGVPQTVIPKMSQETLAEMIGTTRSRVSFFMNRFRKLGFITYETGSGLQVHSSLLNVVLHD